MGKRFTDTEKWKKPFIRALKAPYKLLWLYICDDCDHAGIWQVDMEVAQIRIGEQISEEEAIENFGEKIILIDNGTKWFIPSFIEFQYPGGLSEKNNAHVGIIKILDKYKNQFKPLTSPSNAPKSGAMDMDKDKDMVMDKEMDKDKEKDKKPKIEILLPFNSLEFQNSWSLWKDYKSKEHKFKYKTPQSEQASLMELVKVANGKEDIAIKIINQSMANGWKGFFELKNIDNNGNTKTYQTRTSNKVTSEQLHESLAKRFNQESNRSSSHSNVQV